MGPLGSRGAWARANVSIVDPERPGEVIYALFIFNKFDDQDSKWVWRIDEVDCDPWFHEAFTGATEIDCTGSPSATTTPGCCNASR